MTRGSVRKVKLEGRSDEAEVTMKEAEKHSLSLQHKSRQDIFCCTLLAACLQTERSQELLKSINRLGKLNERALSTKQVSAWLGCTILGC